MRTEAFLERGTVISYQESTTLTSPNKSTLFYANKNISIKRKKEVGKRNVDLCVQRQTIILNLGLEFSKRK